VRQVEDVLGLWGYPVVVLDAVFLQEVIESPNPYVLKHDEGGLKDGADGAGVVHGQEDGLGAEGAGLAGTEAGAEAQDLVLHVVHEVPLGRQEALVDAVAQGFVGLGAAGAGVLRLFEDVAAGNHAQD